MTGRRGSGEGAVYRDKDGLWRASVELGRDPSTGKRQRRYLAARTKAELLRKLESAQGDRAKGLAPVDQRRTTTAYLDWWSSTVLPGTVKDTTADSYAELLTRYVKPHIGSVPLGKLTPAHVRGMLKALEEQGLGANTRRLARAVLRRALQVAVRDEIIHRNVAALVDGPSIAGTRLDDAMTAPEAEKVLAAATGDRLEALAVVVLTLGLRRGEALGLRWSDVDFDAGTLDVSGTLAYRAGVGIVWNTPKTAAGGRTVPMVGGVSGALKEHRRRQAEERLKVGDAWSDEGWVFPTPIGTPIDPRNALRWWYGICKKAGIGRRRLHAARHTCATLMLDRGVPLEVVSAILGHAGLAITADVYARPTADAKRRALEVVATAVAGG